MENNLEKEREQVFNQLKQWHESSSFEINGRTYKLPKLSHEFRINVLSVYSTIEHQIILGNYSFVTKQEFKDVMKKVDDKIIFEDMQISKRKEHFEEYPEDYLDYIAIGLKVICYPLYKTKLNIG